MTNSTSPANILKELKTYIKDGKINTSSFECRALLTMLENCIKNQQITLETAQQELGG